MNAPYLAFIAVPTSTHSGERRNPILQEIRRVGLIGIASRQTHPLTLSARQALDFAAEKKLIPLLSGSPMLVADEILRRPCAALMRKKDLMREGFEISVSARFEGKVVHRFSVSKREQKNPGRLVDSRKRRNARVAVSGMGRGEGCALAHSGWRGRAGQIRKMRRKTPHPAQILGSWLTRRVGICAKSADFLPSEANPPEARQ